MVSIKKYRVEFITIPSDWGAEVAASEFSHLNHSLSHRPVSVKPDISKASSAGAKLHILKPSCERNGITPTLKESLSPTSGSKVPNSPLTGLLIVCGHRMFVVIQIQALAVIGGLQIQSVIAMPPHHESSLKRTFPRKVDKVSLPQSGVRIRSHPQRDDKSTRIGIAKSFRLFNQQD
ncbi:hypothetical protein Tco_0725628 [Tanacetum coccineum]|uniref:Uncharacterized protein n=1 Tax=Tanacetum coccineum TaxID=301880 RepID=A0ABQ4YFV9_9ASTR